MKKITIIFIALISAFSFSQTAPDSLRVNPQNQNNAAQNILTSNSDKKLTIGGYGEVQYVQPEGQDGELNLERMVLFLGYKFNDRVQFVTEIEIEDAKEVETEQAFLQYNLNSNMNLRGGLMLVPMGIVNEYHEPTTFNGVIRPSMDHDIVPTTWREIGVGVSGKFDEVSLRYQAYIFNGFLSVNDEGEPLGGASGLRSGRQEGVKAVVGTPSFSAKLDYYGIQGLRLGFSGYFGRSQAEDGMEDVDGADVGISMLGFDARYAIQRFTARGQFIHAGLSDTAAYNSLYNSDLGSALQGWYLEAAYNLLPLTKQQQLFAFARYEDYNTQASVDSGLIKNDSYDRNDWTFGLSYHIAQGAVVKADYQIKDDASSADLPNQLNFGIGFWF